MHEELASIREVVSLSAREILDSAESLVSRLGYDTTQRTDYFLKAQRRPTLENAGEDLYTVLVTASPQAAGGGRVAVHGDDLEGVQERQEEWAEWATSLPKLDAKASLPVKSAGAATQRVRETPSIQVIFDRQDQLEQIEAGLLPGEEIEAVFDVKGSGTGFVGITSKRIIF